MYLEELIPGVCLESDKLECKSKLNREDVVGWLKSIAGFANAAGGAFYIGVEDKSNKLIGFDKKNADNERNYFNNQVNEHLTPRPVSYTHLDVYKRQHLYLCYAGYHPVLLLLSCYSTVIKNTARMVLVKAENHGFYQYRSG